MSRLLRRVALGLVAFVLGVYVAIVILLFIQQRQLLFPAGLEPPSLERAGLVGLMEPVRIVTADGLTLLSWYHRPPTAGGPLVILFHGNGGTIEIRAPQAQAYIHSRFGMALVQYRGHGGYPGSPSEAGLYADGRAALAFATALGVASNRWIPIGESLGTGVAVQMAVVNHVSALVLQAPYTSVADVAQSDFPWLPVRWLVRDRFDSADKIARIGVPLFIVQGEGAEGIAVRVGTGLFAGAPAAKEAPWPRN